MYASRVMLMAFMVGSQTAAIGAESAPTDASKPRVVEVMKVWQAQSDSVRSGQFQFSHQTRVVDRFSRFQSEWIAQHEDENTGIENHILILDGDRLSYETLRWTYDEHLQGQTLYNFAELAIPKELVAGVTAQRFDRALYSKFLDESLALREPQSFKAICDGQSRFNIWQGDESRPPYVIKLRPPSAGDADWIHFSSSFQSSLDLDGLVYQPLLLAYRPFHPCYAGVVADNCSILEEPSTIDGRECRVIRETVPSSFGNVLHRTYWVDPQRDYRVLRYVGSGADFPTVQFDIQYDEDESGHWHPASWSVMRISADGRDPVQEFAAFRMSSRSLNVPVDREVLRPTIPAGALVLDMDREVSYVMAADRTRRRILDFEYRARAEYGDLSVTLPGAGYDQYLARHRRQEGSICHTLARMPALFAAGLGLVIAGVLYARRRSLRQRSKVVDEVETELPIAH